MTDRYRGLLDTMIEAGVELLREGMTEGQMRRALANRYGFDHMELIGVEAVAGSRYWTRYREPFRKHAA